MIFVVLGLLMFEPLSIYGLRKQFSAGISLFYSDSLGSLQAALKNLLEQGHIQFEWLKQNGRRVKLYSITQSGIAAFFEWMLSPLSDRRLEETVMAKTYFLGLVEDPQQKKLILEDMSAKVAASQGALLAVKDELDSLPAEIQALSTFRYQRAPLDYGIMSHGVALEWIQSMIEEL